MIYSLTKLSEIPKSCSECSFYHDINKGGGCYCVPLNLRTEFLEDCRRSDCPLIENKISDKDISDCEMKFKMAQLIEFLIGTIQTFTDSKTGKRLRDSVKEDNKRFEENMNEIRKQLDAKN